MHTGMFRQIGAEATQDPICVSLSVGTYFTVNARYLTLFYHTPETSYTHLIKVTILPTILFKKNLYILYNYEIMHYLIYKPQSSSQVAIILIKRK